MREKEYDVMAAAFYVGSVLGTFLGFCWGYCVAVRDKARRPATSTPQGADPGEGSAAHGAGANPGGPYDLAGGRTTSPANR